MTTVKEQRQRILDAMKEVEPGTNEYKELIQQLTMLNEANKSIFSLDNNTVISGIAQIATVILVLNFERLNIVTTRSLPFIPRIRN